MDALTSSLADVMVSALVDFISDRLSASEFLNFARREQFFSQLNKWENFLPKINALLEDAQQSHTASRALKLWLSDLRDLAYDAEDIIDEINTEVQRRRILGHTQSATTSKVRFIFPPCCAGFNSSGIKFSGRLGAEMEAITARFQLILEQKNILNLVEGGGQVRLETKKEGLRSTSSLVDESQVFGREQDKQAILERLMDGKTGVISIVGMGGVGKTTLAHVAKDSQFGIRELKDLLHLKGELSITGLENVVHVGDADANLMDKHGIDGLHLKWGTEFLDHQKEEDEMLVLDMLKPSKNLKELTISFYGGTRFPSWLGDPSFANIVHMNLNDCSKSMSLPSLGRLPSLRKLSIQGMNRVKKVGLEFYGDDLPSTKRFPSLEILWFQNMVEWEHWSYTHKGDEDLDDEFPSLRELMIKNCPKLTGDLPRHLPSLVKLIISHCPKLEGSPMSLPSLCELNIEGWNKEQLKNIVDVTSLTTLRIQSFRDLVCLSQEMLQSLGCLSTLRHLTLKDCVALKNLPNWKMMLNYRTSDCLLEDLEIEECPSLTYLPGGNMLTRLQRLKIREPGLSPTLKTLEIHNCANLKSLPVRMQNLTSLQYLTVCECPCLVSFAKEGSSSQLLVLEVWDCINLKEPMSEWNLHSLASLKELIIVGASDTASFPDEKCLLPTTLTSIVISRLNSLGSLSTELYNLTSLE
ncbi:hypothetical protein SLEP1_g23777 [Rubroshorea leprosula]|uniref:Rx N-terminal domain-containing protein n=1 Tax=Rubroshorea leprosula TaxID=152421 RepID=A0AAV5JDF9_9ROSI|nr:hypothetical protein SLEP1_g23777 [Rubroshorea leprosula]